MLACVVMFVVECCWLGAYKRRWCCGCYVKNSPPLCKSRALLIVLCSPFAQVIQTLQKQGAFITTITTNGCEQSRGAKEAKKNSDQFKY